MTQLVKFTNSDGKVITGRLVRENNKTAIVKPYKWIKTPEIKIHKVKNNFELTQETI